jgi:hypothetical protein
MSGALSLRHSTTSVNWRRREAVRMNFTSNC